MIGQRFIAFTCSLFFSTALFAAQLTGTVTNATTGKPAAGDDVTLLSLNGGMQETSSGKTDDQGRFALDDPDENVEHLVRVSHSGTFYYKTVPAGGKTANVDVYDAATIVDNILTQGQVYQMQTGNGQLEVSEKFILRNESVPPRTRIGDHAFEIELPPGAQVVDSMAQGPGSLPVSVVPVPLKAKNHYGMPYPLRPGETQFRVNYKIPYSGSFDFTVTPASSLAELGVILPKSMKLEGQGFAQDTDEAGMSVYFMKDVAAAHAVRFSVSGEGIAPREAQEAPSGGGSQDTGPAPPESSGSRWYVIGLLFGLLAGGVIVVFRKRMKRSVKSERAARRMKAREAGKASKHEEADGDYGSSNGNMIDALKEELFQLETDRLDGKINQHDYEVSKAGLDTLIRRQVKKS